MRARSVFERFAERFIIDQCSGCWLWQGAISGGYGHLRVGNRIERAHRVSYVMFVGPIPDGMTVDHVRDRGCLYRHCVNPAHLEVVTRAENVRRAVAYRSQVTKRFCHKNHPLFGENLGRNGKAGTRVCRTCAADKTRRYRERQKAKAAA